MNLNAEARQRMVKPVLGAVLAIAVGLALRGMPLGERLVNASYDYLFRFGARSITNKVVLVQMDNAAYAELGQSRGRPWNRSRHAELVNKLTHDGCPLIVFDIYFAPGGEQDGDASLAAAMRRHGRVVLMAEVGEPEHPVADAVQALPPQPIFLEAATHAGIAKADVPVGETVRRHWPFPAPAVFPSLPWMAAELAGARLPETPQEQWLRYYGPRGPWTRLSYHFALAEVTNYFRDAIVFIGNEPATPAPGDEKDEFRTPYTRWTGEAVGGMQIMATEFLNLMNGDWLRRPPGWLEVLIVTLAGALLGGGLPQARPLLACGLSAALAVALMVAAAWLSYATNYWIPWLVIAGGQVPCALAWTIGSTWSPRRPIDAGKTVVVSPGQPEERPETPDYELMPAPFGKGAFGKVWLARNAIGQWQALKVIYRQNVVENSRHYEIEFRGISRYKPISDKHPGLLRVDFVSRMKRAGYFYYVMELGDALVEGWETDPGRYVPRDLEKFCRDENRNRKRLPARDCARIVTPLAEALAFLHGEGLTHRDIKPSNIIFVNGRPKLADVGLVTEIRPAGAAPTWAGTPGYMPPPPEHPGTMQADIYGLGMLLYVISTGRDPAFFPDLSASLMASDGDAGFLWLNSIILRACQPDHAQRYASAAEMHAALVEAQRTLDRMAESPES